MNRFLSKKFFIGILLLTNSIFLAYFKTGSVESYIASGIAGVYLMSWVYHQTKIDAGVIKIEASKKEGSNE